MASRGWAMAREEVQSRLRSAGQHDLRRDQRDQPVMATVSAENLPAIEMKRHFRMRIGQEESASSPTSGVEFASIPRRSGMSEVLNDPPAASASSASAERR